MSVDEQASPMENKPALVVQLEPLRLLILEYLLGFCVLLGGLALVLVLVKDIPQHHYFPSVYFTIPYAFMVTLFVLRRLPYAWRASAPLVVFWSIGLLECTSAGVDSLATLFFFGFILFSGLLLGPKASYASLGISLGTIALAMGGHLSGILVVTHLENSSLSAKEWLMSLLNLGWIAGISAFFLTMFARGLERNLSSAQEAMNSLRQEVREREEAESKLRQSEERFRFLVENSSDVLMMINRNGCIRYESPSLVKVLGYPLGSKTDARFVDLLHPDDVALMEQAIARVWAGLPPPANMECRMRHEDGVWRTLEARFGLSAAVEGQADNEVLVLLDITHRKESQAAHERMESQLRQSQKMEAIGALAGGIAHDFNNILDGILGNAELALTQAPKEGPLRDGINTIRNAAHRAAGMVRQILDFSRKTEPGKRPVRMPEIVREVGELLRGSLPASINIQIAADHETPPVLADGHQIHQVLMNLCTNAYHAMRECGGTLVINVEAHEVDEAEARRVYGLSPGSYCRLTVSDTGCGMDAGVLERMFEPYFTTKGAHEGTGLGLAAVHGIVRNHGGVIDAHSEVGCGTRFVIYFPAHAEEGGSEASAPERLHDGHGERILLVDDDTMVRDVYARMLEMGGYRVEPQADPEAALALFSTTPDSFDLLLTDLDMPGMDGFTLVNQVWELRPAFPVLIITGMGHTNIRLEAEAMGITGLLAKPVGAEQLLLGVQAALAATPREA